jgi:hypothetical protein
MFYLHGLKKITVVTKIHYTGSGKSTSRIWRGRCVLWWGYGGGGGIDR